MVVRTRRARRALNPWWIIGGMLALIVVALALIILTRERDAAPRAAAAPAAEFTLDGLEGEVALADFRGRYVLLNFWASWCPPCMAEMPELNAYHTQYQDRGFTLLAVNVQEDAATVRAFLAASGFRFPVALDLNGAVYQRYGGAGLPSSFLIGPDGGLVKAWRPGAITRAMLDRDVTPLLRS